MILAAMRSHQPTQIVARDRRRAAVALILREGDNGPEMLLIERALHPGDLWSGHLAFPGGSMDQSDATPRAAAERETTEEVGLRLDGPGADCLGMLADVDGHPLPLVISAYVYHLREATQLSVDPGEVQQAFWFPLSGLLEPANQLFFDSPYGPRPAVRVLPSDQPVLWGLTYHYVRRFLDLLSHRLPE